MIVIRHFRITAMVLALGIWREEFVRRQTDKSQEQFNRRNRRSRRANRSCFLGRYSDEI
jgi:hypothetical protein